MFLYNGLINKYLYLPQNLHVWLGGLFIPEAYITATRQYVAQANSWSLEELHLDVIVHDNAKDAKLDDCSFGVTGLSIVILLSSVYVHYRYKLYI
jgi:dynein heavy chain 1